jgi:hypothetical protein
MTDVEHTECAYMNLVEKPDGRRLLGIPWLVWDLYTWFLKKKTDWSGLIWASTRSGGL